MATEVSERLPTAVNKPTPYTYDLSHLVAIDANPLPPTQTLLNQDLETRNATLKTYARDGAQSLLNTLLTTTSITSNSDSLLMTLPPADISARTPRWKPLPKPKEPTKWEKFAQKKGIGKFGGSAKGGARLEDRRKNAVYDEEKGEWVKKAWKMGSSRKNGSSKKESKAAAKGSKPA